MITAGTVVPQRRFLRLGFGIEIERSLATKVPGDGVT